ncbi:hypothetical protein FNV43_RR18930 [Rhamnella rubrinervis]|uniref:DNA glycosylase n=1 Tax=Rhamnella rubrinervis TaxID=2594499 RepID=A0A8K0E1L9_9ROSA|nr:hypothetical protein FNV43_RR18930 [Rhamnella rubrinervis]
MEVSKARGEGENESKSVGQCLLLELPLGKAAETFQLETAVCSHGFFMMAPNRWDPVSKTLLRPLRLTLHSLSPSVMVRISQPPHRPQCLHLHVYASTILSLSAENEQALLAQVSRMLRLTETDERVSTEFRQLYERCMEAPESNSMSSPICGRVFRSPSLFEDMVKCILLCNCQWPRTLSMAQALCDLQLELQSESLSPMNVDFIPRTPAQKESKRKLEEYKNSTTLIAQFASRTELQFQAHCGTSVDCAQTNGSCEEDVNKSEPYLLFDGSGNFPSPSELANLDEIFLAKRCKLGYRASRILKLGQDILQGRIHLRQLEETSMERSLSNYSKLAEQMKQIHGFGPFTCANVLMCMGFYHVIPADSETVRHLNQVHARKSTIKTVGKDVEEIYAKYSPYQFLAYWSELWDFYGKRFGKLSEMPYSDYKFITASNLRSKARHKSKRKKTD